MSFITSFIRNFLTCASERRPTTGNLKLAARIRIDCTSLDFCQDSHGSHFIIQILYRVTKVVADLGLVD